MSKIFKIFSFLLLIYIVSTQAIDNDQSNTNFTVLEINESIDNDHAGISFQLKEIDKTYYLSYNFIEESSPLIGSFRLVFDTPNPIQNLTEVFCKFVDKETKDEDLVEILNDLDKEVSDCNGFFTEKDKFIFDGIYSRKNENTKLGIIIRNEGEMETNVNVYLRFNKYALPAEEAHIKEDEQYTRVPYTLSISEFSSKAKQIILYSSKRNLHIYHFETINEETTLEELFSGNVIPLSFEGNNFINRKYISSQELVLVSEPLETTMEVDEEFHFDISFYLNSIVDYYKMPNQEGRPLNKPITVQMVNQNEQRCFVVNYNLKESAKELYVEVISGKIKTLKIETDQKESTWSQMIETAEQKDLSNLSFQLEENKEKHTDIICAENDNYPTLIHFYYVDPINQEETLTPGKSYIYNIPGDDTNVALFVDEHTSKENVDLTFHAYNKENSFGFLIRYGESNEIRIENNTIVSYTEKSESISRIILTNYGDNDVRIIVTVGLQVSEKKSTTNEDFYFDTKNSLYYYKLPKSQEEINYSKMTLTIEGIETESFGGYCFLNSQGNIIEPFLEDCYQVSPEKKNEIEVINPYVVLSEVFNNEKDLPDFYLVFKTLTKGDEEIKISIKKTQFNYEERLPLNKEITLTTDENKKIGYIISGSNRNSLFAQMMICDYDMEITYSVNDSFYHNLIVEGDLTYSPKDYISIDTNYFDTEITFDEKYHDKANFFFKLFESTKGSPNTISEKIETRYDMESKILYFSNPIEDSNFNFTIFIDHLGKLSLQRINICSIANSINNDESLTDTVVVFDKIRENEFKLDFESSELIDYESFDLIVYGTENPSGLSFISNIVSYDKAQSEAIEITDVYKENILYYFGKLVQPNNFYSIDLPQSESIITVHLGKKVDNLEIKCAQTESIIINEINEKINEQEKLNLCTVFPDNNNDRIYNILYKLDSNISKKLAIRIDFDSEEDDEIDVGIFFDKDNNKELTLDSENEDKIMKIQNPYSYKYYTISLNTLRERNYKQIGLFSKTKEAFYIIVNIQDHNENIVIDYGNLIVLNTNEDYISNYYSDNQKLLVLIGDSTSDPVTKVSQMERDYIEINLLVLSKNDQLVDNINILDYQSIISSNIDYLNIPITLEKCDNNVDNYVIINIREEEPEEAKKRFIKIKKEYGDLAVDYIKDFNYNIFKDQLSHLSLLENDLLSFTQSEVYILKIKCNHYLFMDIRGFEPIEDKSIILESNSIKDLQVSDEQISVDLKDLQESFLQVEISSETEFSIHIAINEGAVSIDLNGDKKNEIIDLNKKNYNIMTISSNKGEGNVHLYSSIKSSDLVKNDNGISVYNDELYIYLHSVIKNNNSTKIKFPVKNNESKPIKVCYYLTPILIDLGTKKIFDCVEIPEHITQNITVINPYDVNPTLKFSELKATYDKVYIVLYKNVKESESKLLEIGKVIVEDENKKDDKPDDKKDDGNKEQSNGGRIVMTVFVVIIILLVLLFLAIYIRKKQLRNKELRYKQLLNKERELLSTDSNNYNPLMGGIISLENC